MGLRRKGGEQCAKRDLSEVQEAGLKYSEATNLLLSDFLAFFLWHLQIHVDLLKHAYAM